jgi:hypothetical protein
MKAELRALLTIDHDRLDAVQPVGDEFCISLRALIGPAGEPGEESFDFDVCSPAWLSGELAREPIINGRFRLVCRDFDPPQIVAYVRERVEQTTGTDWPMVAGKLARWSQWEFEDYRER